MEEDLNPSSHRKLNWLRLVLVITLLLNILGLYQFVMPAYESGILQSSRNWMAVTGLGMLGIVAELALLAATWTPLKRNIFWLIDTVTRFFSHLRFFNVLLFIAGVALYAYLVLGPYGEHVQHTFTRLFLFWLVVLGGCVLLKAWSLTQDIRLQRRWVEFLGVSLLFSTFGIQLAGFLPEISTYPFTLSWSETSRFYYASLFFSEHIYGFSVPPTVLHPSRYLLQAVPFLVPNTPLWLHRAWQVFLWMAITLSTAILLVRRLGITGRYRRLLLIMWSSIFILLGPIYYHLQVPVILILWLYPRASSVVKYRCMKSLTAVLVASAWAGISRINWFPVPGLLAAMLFFLETPIGHLPQDDPKLTPKRPIWRYLFEPAFWALFGTGVAFAAQALYIWVSGNEAEQFTTSFMSDLLWYRLFPSPTYPPGILPATLLVSLPMFLLIASRLIGTFNMVPAWRFFHPIRLLGLAAILFVLMAGGLVVSTKIGGGSNLHNLDAYMALLLVATVTIYTGNFVPDRAPNDLLSAKAESFSILGPSGQLAPHQKIQSAGILLSLVIPAYFAVMGRGAVEPLPDAAKISRSLQQITQHVTETSQKGGEVLFLTDRHLLTFNYLEDVPLVPEYERVFLMEMAMAGAPDYLSKFHADLKDKRFALIISEPLFIQEKGRSAPFGEENDAWVEQVSKYILCYYQPLKQLPAVRVQLLVPRQKVKACP